MDIFGKAIQEEVKPRKIIKKKLFISEENKENVDENIWGTTSIYNSAAEIRQAHNNYYKTFKA
jgi:hypothetical protein